MIKLLRFLFYIGFFCQSISMAFFLVYDSWNFFVLEILFLAFWAVVLIISVRGVDRR